MTKTILIIDDERGSRESLREIFHSRYQIVLAENALEGLAILSKRPIDLIMVDAVMPKMSGCTLLREVREIYPDVPVVMISASVSEKTMEEALKLGAIGFVKKPFNINALRYMVDQSLLASDAPRQREVLEMEVSRKFPLYELVCQSTSFRRVIDHARRISESSLPVLIIGERGTGKEFVARQIHAWSKHSADAFVPVNCGGNESKDAEIFGTARGHEGSNRRGGFDLVGDGTLYLDEVDNLEKKSIAKITAVLQSREFQRIGAHQSVPVAGRVIASITASVNSSYEGLVGPEFIASVSSAILKVPPLRDRPEDIPLLAYHFLNQLRVALAAQTLDIHPETMAHLRNYPWPGNIRELRNVIERMLLLGASDKCLAPSLLPKEFREPEMHIDILPDETSFHSAVGVFERRLIVNALQRSNGIVRNAAALLHMTPRILQHRIVRLKIKKTAR